MFIASRLCNVIKHAPTIPVCATREMVSLIWNYQIKYGKAWQAKQRALKLCYSDWDMAYERLPDMLQNAMKAKNPGMHFEYILKPNMFDAHGRKIFYRAFWTFG